MALIKDLNRWKTEIKEAERYRDEEFGEFTRNEKVGAGENIQYFERGWADRYNNATGSDSVRDWILTTVNIVDAIVSIMVPSLGFQNPRTVVLPKKIESEGTAPIVAKIIDHYRKELGVEDINRRIIWDAYVLGMGVDKVGYTTKVGMDVPDEEAEKKQKKTLIDRVAEATGLKKKEEELKEQKEMNYRILSENPFIEYVSPFNFGMDIRATNFSDTMYRYHKVRKTIQAMKVNKKYKNTADLKGIPPEIPLTTSDIGSSDIEAFHTVDVFEIHYRNGGKWYLLVLSKDRDGTTAEHYHAESIYDLCDWQLDILALKKHGHRLYPVSDITKVKALQDRLTLTIDNILEQVDRFVPKLAYHTSGLTEQGKVALETGGIGALVECNSDPNAVFNDLNFTQVKADLQRLIDQIISLISLQTGMSRTQLTGLSDAQTATEATFEQGGQNIRTSGMQKSVEDFINRQSERLWKVIKQFVSLEELQLINGIKGMDESTGQPLYNWLTISSEQAEQMKCAEYDFNIEMGSTQKVNLPQMRKAFENLFNILARTDVLIAMQQQGDNVRLAETFKKYLDLFPELGIDSAKIVQTMQSPTGGIITPAGGQGGQTAGSAQNASAALLNQGAQTAPQAASEAAQI